MYFYIYTMYKIYFIFCLNLNMAIFILIEIIFRGIEIDNVYETYYK